MDLYLLLQASVAILLASLLFAFFQNKAEIGRLSAQIRVLEDGKVKLETENRELIQKMADLQRIHVEQQARIAEHESLQSVLDKYPPDSSTGYTTDPRTQRLICPVCLQESPPVVMNLEETDSSWSCPKGYPPHFFEWKRK